MAARGAARYEEIAADLRARIEAGEFPVDSQIPVKPALMKRYGVALGTVNAALRELVADGLVETQQGRGIFVRVPPPPEPDVSDQVAALQREVAALRDRVAAGDGHDELTTRVGRIEANLMDLYAHVGREYPHGKKAAAGNGRRTG